MSIAPWPIIERQHKRIAELESRLAEAHTEIGRMQKRWDDMYGTPSQLAEAQAENERLIRS